MSNGSERVFADRAEAGKILAGELGKHGADRVEGLFRFALLDHANESVDHDDTENDTGVDPLIENRGANRGGEKDVDQDVVELKKKTFEQAVTGRRGKLVGSVPGKQRGGLGRGEPIPGLRAEFGQDVLQFCSVPGHRFDFIVDHLAWGDNANRW